MYNKNVGFKKKLKWKFWIGKFGYIVYILNKVFENFCIIENDWNELRFLKEFNFCEINMFMY